MNRPISSNQRNDACLAAPPFDEFDEYDDDDEHDRSMGSNPMASWWNLENNYHSDGYQSSHSKSSRSSSHGDFYFNDDDFASDDDDNNNDDHDEAEAAHRYAASAIDGIESDDEDDDEAYRYAAVSAAGGHAKFSSLMAIDELSDIHLDTPHDDYDMDKDLNVVVTNSLRNNGHRNDDDDVDSCTLAAAQYDSKFWNLLAIDELSDIHLSGHEDDDDNDLRYHAPSNAAAVAAAASLNWDHCRPTAAAAVPNPPRPNSDRTTGRSDGLRLAIDPHCRDIQVAPIGTTSSRRRGQLDRNLMNSSALWDMALDTSISEYSEHVMVRETPRPAASTAPWLQRPPPLRRMAQPPLPPVTTSLSQRTAVSTPPPPPNNRDRNSHPRSPSVLPIQDTTFTSTSYQDDDNDNDHGPPPPPTPYNTMWSGLCGLCCLVYRTNSPLGYLWNRLGGGGSPLEGTTLDDVAAAALSTKHALTTAAATTAPFCPPPTPAQLHQMAVLASQSAAQNAALGPHHAAAIATATPISSLSGLPPQSSSSSATTNTLLILAILLLLALAL
jgi:hypothetical protein